MTYAEFNRTNYTARVDLRSDTVTHPSEGMKNAMISAPLGDDVYGDDPSVNFLQEKVAKLFDKEAALLVSSGTQSNLCAMLAHCQRGDEILTGDHYHVFMDEAGGASVLGGVMFAPLVTQTNGGLSVNEINRKIKPDDDHCAVSKMLSLENTHQGKVLDVEEIENLASCGHNNGLNIHLDGARLMNAVVKLDVEAKEFVSNIDSVSLCLSKGLGAPAGSVLSGSESFIKKAKRIRKLLGGGLRQAGILAAAGIYALDNNVDRMAIDHENALRLAEQLNNFSALSVDPDKVQTNMVFIELDDGIAEKFRYHLLQKGMLIGAGETIVRLVTHLDCNADDVDLFVKEVDAFFN
ncbi:low-specificity L-threonine aldolase [Rhodobacteraceae bacterium]|nr:low-specificity L-threonine aldolase [Paracoccaceae bacterium]